MLTFLLLNTALPQNLLQEPFLPSFFSLSLRIIETYKTKLNVFLTEIQFCKKTQIVIFDLKKNHFILLEQVSKSILMLETFSIKMSMFHTHEDFMIQTQHMIRLAKVLLTDFRQIGNKNAENKKIETFDALKNYLK
jgi:hypothetical protein